MNIELIGIEALQASFETHNALGESGKEELQKNQFGDTAMRGDYEAEEAVLEVLRKYNLPAIIHLEEHGQVKITEEPSLLGVLDGIDGSSWYRSEWGVGRYGTMLGIYKGVNPQYKDYIFGGIMEHATKRLFYGIKGVGSWVIDLNSGKKKGIHTSDEHDLSTSTRIHIDEYWDINNEVFRSKLDGYNVMPYKLCSSIHYTDTSMGEADLTLECTRKGSLEIATAFPLITEAGGAMVTLAGKSLSDEYYLKFGTVEHIPVITAATPELATKTASFFSNKF